MDLTGQKRKRVMPTTTSIKNNGARAVSGSATLSLTASQSEPVLVLQGESFTTTTNMKNSSHTNLLSSSLHGGRVDKSVISGFAPTSNRQSVTMEKRPAVKVPSLSPAQYWKRALAEWNITIQPTRDQSYFLQATSERIQAYDRDLLVAIRRQDLTQLQSMMEGGKLRHNACNAFGESLLHLACRKGMTQVVQFLVGTAKLSCWVHDDYGRTIAHDMCWTVQPNWSLVQFVLQQAPILLTLSDVRGHIALDYVPKSDWDAWLDFLAERKSDLKELLLLATNNNIQPPISPPNAKEESTTTTTATTTKTEVTATTSFPTSAAAGTAIAPQKSLHRLTDQDNISCSSSTVPSSSGSSATLDTIQEGWDENETRMAPASNPSQPQGQASLALAPINDNTTM
jgi:hypothetical protein